MTDAQVVARYGVRGLDAFRSRASEMIDEGEDEGSDITAEGAVENGEDANSAVDAMESEKDLHEDTH